MTEKERVSRRDAARRMRARQRGENVPFLKSGPKPDRDVVIGAIFGKLKVAEFVEKGKTSSGGMWRCECQCGCETSRVVSAAGLRKGCPSSCRSRSLTPETKHRRLTEPRTCRLCNKSKPPSSYKSHKGFICKRCERRNALLGKYGITLEDYARMFREQDGKCFICRTPPTAEEEVLCVDHHHLSGIVRKLLCFSCNSAIGYLHESAERAVAIAGYLTEYEKIIQVSKNHLTNGESVVVEA
jgi:hypothetical protein